MIYKNQSTVYAIHAILHNYYYLMKIALMVATPPSHQVEQIESGIHSIISTV